MPAFGRHLAELVWWVLNTPDEIEPQKVALKSLREHSRDRAHRVEVSGLRLLCDGEPVPEHLDGVHDLVAQLVGHQVKRMDFAMGVPPAELLSLARLLADAPTPPRAGDAFAVALAQTGIEAVSVLIEATLRPTPLSTAAAPAAPAASAPQQADEVHLFFAAARPPSAPAEELLRQLRETQSVNTKTRLLDELSSTVENAMAAHKPELVVDCVSAIVEEEEKEPNPELKRAWTAAFRRLEKPSLFLMVAAFMVSRADKIPQVMRVLIRGGDSGADALMSLMRETQSMTDRRIYFDAMLRHRPRTIHLLNSIEDARWFAARNACDFVAEARIVEAVEPLIGALQHSDERVRRSAAVALAQLGTPEAVDALKACMSDRSPSVRLLAAQAFASLRSADATQLLVDAVQSEKDAKTQEALLTLIGKTGTNEALQHLAKVAEPETRLFMRKSSAVRIAAIRALGEIRSSESVAALQALSTDKDKEVAETAALTARVVMRRTGELTPSTLEAIKNI